MTPPPSTPKKTRRVQPKIIGHTSPTPRISGTTARTSLRSLGGTLTAASSNHRPNATPGVRTPVGAPGMHGFPRARVTARDNNSGCSDRARCNNSDCNTWDWLRANTRRLARTR